MKNSKINGHMMRSTKMEYTVDKRYLFIKLTCWNTIFDFHSFNSAARFFFSILNCINCSS
jgi:hypothetical protein